MLLYANDRLWVIAFATAVGIGSKCLIRVPVGHGRVRHCLNPSNTGIALTLLLFPWVGIAPPYQFTENLDGVGDWFLPGIIVLSGTFLNTRFTGQGAADPGLARGLRAPGGGAEPASRGRRWSRPCCPITGMAFLLFTFYMVTDPATTPSGTLGQLAFGGSVAATYGLLTASHVVFGLFFSLLIVCSIRGLGLASLAWVRSPVPSAGDRPDTGPRRDRTLAGPGSGRMMSTSIALVGLACEYPDARSPAELWENVLAGRRAFRRMPPERLRHRGLLVADRDAADRTYAVEAAADRGLRVRPRRVPGGGARASGRPTRRTGWRSTWPRGPWPTPDSTEGDGLPRETTGVFLGNTLTGEFSRARAPAPMAVCPAGRSTRPSGGEGWSPKRRGEFLDRLEDAYKSPFPPVGEETLAGEPLEHDRGADLQPLRPEGGRLHRGRGVRLVAAGGGPRLLVAGGGRPRRGARRRAST